jgi:hypothetical protein
MSFVKPVVLGLMAVVAGLVCAPAKAQEGFPTASQEIVIWSARACYAEATWSRADCSALLHVIRKRATKFNWPFLKMLKKYSVVNWLRGTRGRQTGSLALTANKNQSAKWNENWQELVSHVKDILADNVTDPCPNADHWAATYYVPRSPMRRVRCSQKVENAFWRSVRE